MALSSIVLMPTTYAKPRERQVVFDTDSNAVGIDNRASACISCDADDFEGPLQECKRAIKGFGGTKTYNVYQGTLLWSWEDDDGKVHTFRIPQSYYIPQGKVRLLSPQHWAKTQKDTKPTAGTMETTDHKKVILQWKQRQFKRTVPIHPSDNVATFRLAPGFKAYATFCQEADFNNSDHHDPLTAEEMHVIPDEDKEDSTVPHQPPPSPWKPSQATPDPPTTPHTVDMDNAAPEANCYKGIPVVEDDTFEREPKTLPLDKAPLWPHLFPMPQSNG